MRKNRHILDFSITDNSRQAYIYIYIRNIILHYIVCFVRFSESTRRSAARWRIEKVFVQQCFYFLAEKGWHDGTRHPSTRYYNVIVKINRSWRLIYVINCLINIFRISLPLSSKQNCKRANRFGLDSISFYVDQIDSQYDNQ